MKKVLTTTMAITALIALIASGTLTAADFDGDSRDDIAIFRPSSGLWAVRGVTRVYFGGSTDDPAAGDYNGDGIADIGIYRGNAGLWAIKGVTRVYFGGSTDQQVTGGAGGQRLYDYVVKAGDGDDLEAALESTTYTSVFIPAGTYFPSSSVTVTHVTRIIGENRNNTTISFSGTHYLAIASTGCTVENLRVMNGGFTNIGNIYISASDVTIRDCRSLYSSTHGFQYTASASFVSLINCSSYYSGEAGFSGQASVNNSRLLNCVVVDIATGTGAYRGFDGCNNLTNCYVDGENSGYYQCNNISSSVAYNCFLNGFWQCGRLSSCEVDGNNQTTYAFYECTNLSSCHVENTTYYYQACDYFYGSIHGHENSCD